MSRSTATAAPISKRFFCTSRAARNRPWSRRSDAPERPAPGDAPGRRGAFLAGAGVGDAAALPVHPAQLVAAHPGAVVLADLADADLGVHDPVPTPEQQLCRAGVRRIAGRGDAVGLAVPLAARPVDLVSRGDVGAQSRAALRDAVAPL